jgi:hypothetical protein
LIFCFRYLYFCAYLFFKCHKGSNAMPKLILKAIVSAKSSGAPASEQVLGQVDTAADAQRLSVPAQAQTQYRLVDGKTGQVIKNQTVLRKGMSLHIEVDGTPVVELDNFFPQEATEATAQAQGATYLVDTSATAEPSYGLVTAQTSAGDMVGESSVMWTTGMPALPLTEPVAFGPQALSALSGAGSIGGWVLSTGVAVVANNNVSEADSAAAKAAGHIIQQHRHRSSQFG